MNEADTLASYRVLFEAIYRQSGAEALELSWSGFLDVIEDEPEV